MTISRDTADRGHLPPVGNILINPNFTVNQRVWASGGNLSAVGDYFVDRWCAATANTAPTLSGVTLTIPAGDSVKQIVEDNNMPAGTYNVSWDGTAQCDVEGLGLASSPVEFTVVGGSDITLEWGPGTLSNPMLVAGTKPAPFVARQITEEESLCHRYFIKMAGRSTEMGIKGYITGGGSIGWQLNFPVTMRAVPTATKYGTWTANNVQQPAFYPGINTCRCQCVGAAVGPGQCNTTGSTTYVTFDAEL